MQDQGRKGSGLAAVREVWGRRKGLAALAFLGALGAVAGAAASLPDLYRATATVLVERQQVPEAFVRPSVTGEAETRLHTISEEVLSRSRLLDLIRRFDLYPHLRRRGPLEAAVDQMRRDIGIHLKGVEQTGGRTATIAFTLGYRGRDPQTVAQVTNALASFFVAENLRIREQQAAGTTEFLKTQLAEAKRRLDDQEQRVREVRARHQDELPEQLAVNLATLQRLNTQLNLNSERQIRALERRETLMRRLAEADSVAPAGEPDRTAARLLKLNQELTELRTRFSDKYPDVIRVKTEIAALEHELTGAKATGRPGAGPAAAKATSSLLPKGAVAEATEEIRGLKAEEDHLRRDIAAYQRRVENTPKAGQELQEVTRDYEAARELYNSLLKRYQEAQMAESMEQRQKGEGFRILDPAVPPKEPAAPNRLRLIFLGVALSLGLAIGAVVVAEQFDASFHTVDELRAFTRVPILVSIPPVVTGADRRRRRWRLGLGAVAFGLGLVLIVGAAYYLAHGNDRLVEMLVRGRS